jgi:hypothetical protein
LPFPSGVAPFASGDSGFASPAAGVVGVAGGASGVAGVCATQTEAHMSAIETARKVRWSVVDVMA